MMFIAVFSGFILAPFVPLIHKYARQTTGWLISLLPFSLFTYFAIYIPRICSEKCDPIKTTIAWFSDLGIHVTFYLDGLSLIFSLLISGIGTLVVIYAGGYLRNHANLGRFYVYILLFMGSMLGVVLSGNLITLFIFWELTSFTSYMLIGFNNESEKARSAALQALLVTGIGGLALMVGLLMLGHVGGSFEYADLLNKSDVIHSHPLYVPILLLVLAGAFTKSAQIPFHFWLPGAMEAPAPVSTYLHSATMVKAGIYLLARLNPILGETQLWSYLITTFGALTMVVGALLALAQTDLKKLLAYTTVSALGMLVTLIGIGTEQAIEAAMVFLLVHSLYKGALFMVAGSLDHETGTRDVRELSGLLKLMPITAIAAGLAAFSMSGFPPLLGFIGKELIYEAKLHAPSAAIYLLIAGIVANAINVTVAVMVGVRPFIGEQRQTPVKAHEAPSAMWVGPLVMALFGLILGVFPGLISIPFISPAVSAIYGEKLIITLKAFHGLNFILLLSFITIIAGLVFFYTIKSIRKFATKLKFLLPMTPTNLYNVSLDGMLAFAKLQTRILQNGYQRYYLMTIFSVTAALVGYKMISATVMHDLFQFDNIQFYEVGLVVIMIMATFMALLTSSRLAAVAALGVVGYGIALIYIFYGAPDLALTQFLIETLTVILFALVVYYLPRFPVFSHRIIRVRDIIIATLIGAMMTGLVLMAGKIQLSPTISRYFDEASVPLAHGRNIVNVILVDFRGIDTMGEITVLSVAAIGVYALLKLKFKSKGD